MNRGLFHFSYFLIHPPGEKSEQALQVAHNLLLTLGLTVKELKSKINL